MWGARCLDVLLTSTLGSVFSTPGSMIVALSHPWVNDGGPIASGALISEAKEIISMGFIRSGHWLVSSCFEIRALKASRNFLARSSLCSARVHGFPCK